MSLIVKGVKIPDCCGLCELSDSEDDGIYCKPLEKMMWYWLDEVPDERLPNCPLVELIRCKDCRWFINKECAIYCLSSAHEETFCSYAEPKEDNK